MLNTSRISRYPEMHFFEAAIVGMQSCICCIDYSVLHEDYTIL
jgi:hypothetical protein